MSKKTASQKEPTLISGNFCLAKDMLNKQTILFMAAVGMLTFVVQRFDMIAVDEPNQFRFERYVGDVRGSGLFIGVEFVKDQISMLSKGTV